MLMIAYDNLQYLWYQNLLTGKENFNEKRERNYPSSSFPKIYNLSKNDSDKHSEKWWTYFLGKMIRKKMEIVCYCFNI